MKLLLKWLLSAAALLFVAYIYSGVEVKSFPSALIAAFVIGLFNVVLRPVLVVLTLPVTIVTVGLFLFVINALMFWAAASVLDGFHVAGFSKVTLRSVAAVQAEVCNRHVDMMESLSCGMQPCVEFAIHHIAKIPAQPMARIDHRRAPIKGSGRADEVIAQGLDVTAALTERWQGNDQRAECIEQILAQHAGFQSLASL